MKYNNKEAWKLVDEVTEAFQYFLLKASNQLAQEKVSATILNAQSMFDGMPIDTYKKDVDNLVKRKLSYDWTNLRKTIKQHGSSDTVRYGSNVIREFIGCFKYLNGIRIIRDYLSVKKSKKGTLKQIVAVTTDLKISIHYYGIC